VKSARLLIFSFHDESLELRVLANNLQNNGTDSKKNYSTQVGQLSRRGRKRMLKVLPQQNIIIRDFGTRRTDDQSTSCHNIII